MIFTSTEYILFATAVVFLHWLLPLKWRNYLLLAASLFFCGYIHLGFLIPLLGSVVISYSAGRLIQARPQHAKWLLSLAILVHILTLVIFKYYGFFAENIVLLARTLSWDISLPTLNIILPIGISFYTLTQIGYLVDVFRNKQSACTNFVSYALFVCLFPHLVSGPISRGRQLLPQIEGRRHITPQSFERGISLIVWGYFQKLVIADNLAVLANKVFATAHPPFPMLWAAVLAYTVQIFADFSGYTDVARGTGLLFGFELPRNFDHPYLSRSPIEFWRRWHMTLSFWLRDYVYIPLGGSRVGNVRTYLNILVTFAVSGLWHGAGWNYVAWGVYWGMLVGANRLTRQTLNQGRWSDASILRYGSIVGTFLLTMIGWLIFRETSWPYVVRYFALSPLDAPLMAYQVAVYQVLVVLFFAMPLVGQFIFQRKVLPWILSSPHERVLESALRAAVSAVLLLGIVSLSSTVGSDFIYFQF